MEEIKQKIKWIVANHTSVAEADPLNTELEDELFALFSQALQKRDEEILELVRKHVIPETIFATVKAYPTESETLAWDECAVTAKENLNDLQRHLST